MIIITPVEVLTTAPVKVLITSPVIVIITSLNETWKCYKFLSTSKLQTSTDCPQVLNMSNILSLDAQHLLSLLVITSIRFISYNIY